MKIKTSNRGLTFSFKENESFKVGTKYRYIMDVTKQEIILMPDEQGDHTISRKGKNQKPLVDLRAQEVKNMIANATFLEISFDDNIIVSIIKDVLEIQKDYSECELKDLFDHKETETLVFDRDEFARQDPSVYEALQAAGLFSAKTNSEISYVFDVISLFSGAGLLDYPFRNDTDFRIQSAVDFDKDACETYRHNIGDHILCADMRDVIPEDLACAHPDLIIGGPCCQGYSNANRHNLDSQTAMEKRSLVDDYIRIVKAKHPMLFVIENVPQFITKEHGRYLEKVITGLPEYAITYQIVTDNAIGGYTTRRRMILIGSRIGKIYIPDVELESYRVSKDALKKVDQTWFNANDITKASEATKRKMTFVQPGHNYKDIPEMKGLDRHSDTYYRLDPEKPAPTIVNWRKVNMMPPVGNRILSVSEVAALMGLPKSFHLFGSLNAKQQQLGNGVTIAIASFVKSIVKNALLNFVNSHLTPIIA